MTDDSRQHPAIAVETTARVRTITFDRPAARNALTTAMRNHFIDLLEDADRDAAVDVVVVTGTDPAFCAGVDLKELRARDPAERPASPPSRNPGTGLRALTKPVVCAVNGACATGGLEIALSCHFIVASERASFADRHAQFGLVPAWGMSALLPAAVGVRLAREMSLTGRFLDAAEALRAGLVNHVVPHAELMPFSRELARSIVAGDQRANRALLELYARSDGARLDERLANETATATAWVVDRVSQAR
jgi:enoyl-CoA hydratase